MNTTPSSTPHFTPAAGERALVLHGGGSAGNAWEIGVIAGLFDAGLDVTEADLIIGTSAGVDGRGPDHQRDPGRTAGRHPYRCAPATA